MLRILVAASAGRRELNAADFGLVFDSINARGTGPGLDFCHSVLPHFAIAIVEHMVCWHALRVGYGLEMLGSHYCFRFLLFWSGGSCFLGCIFSRNER